eukprot:gene14574-4304_t
MSGDTDGEHVSKTLSTLTEPAILGRVLSYLPGCSGTLAAVCKAIQKQFEVDDDQGWARDVWRVALEQATCYNPWVMLPYYHHTA